MPALPIMWLLFPNSIVGVNLRHNHHAVTQQYAKGAAADVYYIPELLDRFKVFAVQQQALTDHRHTSEVDRLELAIKAAKSPSDKALLQSTVQDNLESRMEAQNAYTQLLNFVNTLKAVATGADTSARTCAEITCGQYAVCAQQKHGAKCQCEEGFEGNGFQCFPPHHFTAQPLFKAEGGKKPNVKEVFLTVFNDVHLAVVYRNSAEGDKGYIVVGRAGLAVVKWGKPKLFSGIAKAYGPVVAGLGTHSILIGYRDSDKSGTGLIVSGALMPKDDFTLRLSTPEVFAKNQAQSMAILQLPHNRGLLMYAERVVDAEGNVLEAFGSACLAQVDPPANVSDVVAPITPPAVMGKYRFADVAVSRLSATLLSDSSFVVGYRGITQGEGGEKPPFREASVVWGQVKDGEVAFSPNPVTLEPDTSQIWGRGVAVVSQNMFAYSYYCGIAKETKMTIIKVDPATHSMAITDGPYRLSQGESSYVGAINVPFAPESPHTYTFFDKPGEKVGTAQICRVSAMGRIADCRERPFAGYDIASISGQLLWDGRLVFAFASKTGEPFYQVEALFAGEAPKKAHENPANR